MADVLKKWMCQMTTLTLLGRWGRWIIPFSSVHCSLGFMGLEDCVWWLRNIGSDLIHLRLLESSHTLRRVCQFGAIFLHSDNVVYCVLVPHDVSFLPWVILCYKTCQTRLAFSAFSFVYGKWLQFRSIVVKHVHGTPCLKANCVKYLAESNHSWCQLLSTSLFQ